MSTWINGAAGSALSSADRGLGYGDGLFETMRLERQSVRHLERHLMRLAQGCRRLGIERLDIAVVRGEIARAVPTLSDGVLKLVVTRGPGPRGYRPSGNELPTRILSWGPPRAVDPAAASVGVRVRFCATPATENTALAGLKHLNRLDSVLAQLEWSDSEIAEGLLRDSQGSVVGGTMSNLFVVRGRTVLTPRVDRCGVSGIMRSVVIDAARSEGIHVVEQPLSAADLTAVDEMFLTSSIIGVWPVRALEGKSYAVGELTRRVQAAAQRVF
jgi:4-amino-4-deoxychorismate lyase